MNDYYSTPLLFIVSLISLKLFMPDSIIRKWQSQLNENGLSGSTINRVTTTLRIVLKQAYRDKKIRRLPVIEAVATSPVGKDIFKPDEIRALFSVDWPDFRFQVGNLLAATTGMRAGEVAALREKYVYPEYIEVIESYDPKFGLHLPKTGKKRIVPIPDKMYEALQKLLSENPHDGENRFIFYSVTPEKPNDPNTFNRALKTAIADILKIEEKDRADRGLTFHSWRSLLGQCMH